MSEEVRRMSDELARDPSSRVFVGLGEALRRLRQTDLARTITLRGLERHPHLAEAHDLLARISVDSGDLERAFDEWDMVLRLSPGHLGALKGMGFVCFRREQFGEAERYLGAAAQSDPSDEEVLSALQHVRALAPMTGTTADPAEGDSRYLFVAELPDEGQTALLLDKSAGAYVAWDGRDVAQDVGAELSGVTDAARRTTRHLALGDWTSIVFETDVAVVALAPAPQDGLLVLATSRATPLGLVRRLLDRCSTRARHWMEASLA
jgi:tetratricopeptide (TPR) repeat protein